MQRLSEFGTRHIGPWIPDRLTTKRPIRVSQIISASAHFAIPESQIRHAMQHASGLEVGHVCLDHQMLSTNEAT
jgi:hypothetical protein